MRGWGGWGGLCGAPFDWAVREGLPEKGSVQGGWRGPADIRGKRVPGRGLSQFRKRPGEAVAARVEVSQRVLQGLWGQNLRLEPDSFQVEFSPGHQPASQASHLPQPQLEEGWREGTQADLNLGWSTLQPPVAARLTCQQWVFNYLNIAFALYFPPGLLSSAKGK